MQTPDAPTMQSLLSTARANWLWLWLWHHLLSFNQRAHALARIAPRNLRSKYKRRYRHFEKTTTHLRVVVLWLCSFCSFSFCHWAFAFAVTKRSVGEKHTNTHTAQSTQPYILTYLRVHVYLLPCAYYNTGFTSKYSPVHTTVLVLPYLPTSRYLVTYAYLYSLVLSYGSLLVLTSTY